MTERTPSPDPLLVASARRLIRAYRPRDVKTRNTPDKLCLHTEDGLMWREILTAACSPNADLDALTDLSKEVLRIADGSGLYREAAEGLREMTWTERRVRKLHVALKNSYEEYFNQDDQSRYAEKRNFMAFLARLTVVVGVTDCPVLFFSQFAHILELPEDKLSTEVSVEDLVMIADYFRFTGAWMKARFGVAPITSKYLVRDLTYNEIRWEIWKKNLRRLAERSDTRVRAYVVDILGILEGIS